MPASNESIQNASVSINFNVGRTSVLVRTYQLDAGDAMAQAAAIDRAAECIVRDWPNVVYRNQIEDLVKGESCPNPKR